jgi:hypothetical protein
MWILARAKLKGGQKYYGAYLGGFPERARALLGVSINDRVLHVCGGMARYYPYAGGFGHNDKTLDLDPATEPDYLQDARDPWPEGPPFPLFSAYLIDPPYSALDAKHYLDGKGASVYPSPNELLKRAFEVMEVGQRVGIIHYCLPKAPANSRFVACVGIICGFNNRIRCYSVFEKLPHTSSADIGGVSDDI